MRIKIITIGKPKGDFESLFNEYVKRIGSFEKVEVFHIKEDSNAEKKASDLMEKTFKVIMSEEGKKFSSRSFAQFLEKRENAGQGDISFFIGGPDGHSMEMRDSADTLMSMSDLTMPHDLAMVFMVETIYRSLSINNNHPYHRD